MTETICATCGKPESAWCRLELCDEHGTPPSHRSLLERVLYVGLNVEYRGNREWADAVEDVLEDVNEVLANTNLTS